MTGHLINSASKPKVPNGAAKTVLPPARQARDDRSDERGEISARVRSV
jgi:hypothetical protein